MEFSKSKCWIHQLGQDIAGYVYETSLLERDRAVWVDGRWNMSQQCAWEARRAICVLGCSKHSTARVASWRR